MAEAAVYRHLTASVRYFAGQREYTKMSAIEAHITVVESEVVVLTPRSVLDAMDHHFASPTQVERDRELANELDKIRASKGVMPSQAITQARLTYTRMFGADNRGLVDRSVRSYITNMLMQESDALGCLQPFTSKLLDASFAELPLESWQSQFRIFEKQPGFEAALLSTAGKKEAAPRRAREVNLLGQEDSLDKFIAAMVPAMAKILGHSSVPPSMGGGGVNTLGAKPPAGGGYRSERGPAWVAEYGCPGYAAPGDDRRKALPIGKICQALDIAVPEGCPKHPDAMVGPQCPCNVFKQIPADKWYYAPMSDEFKAGKDTRRPPIGDKQFAYYHKLGKCRRMREEAHKLAHHDSTLQVLLNPLPRGATDCLSV